MTVRNEIERLTAEGSVYRLQGRGTFVAEPRIAQAGALTSFTEDMLARGHVPGSRVISSEVVAADGFLAAALELKAGDSCFRLDRVRTADGRPMAIEQVHLPLERFEGIDGVDFAGASLFEVLVDAFGVALGEAEQRVVAVAIEAGDAPLLGVPEGAPGLRFHTVTRDRGGIPVLYAVSLYPGDRYEIALRQTRE
jgi:GntR family transcriptional regulator